MSPILDLQNLTPISLEDLDNQNNTEQLKQEEKIDTLIDTTLNSKKEEIETKIKTIKTNAKRRKEEKEEKENYNLDKPISLLLSIKECETLSGISKVSIRKALKEKELNYTIENKQYRIAFKELLKWCYSSTRRKNVFNTKGIGQYVNEWK